MTRRREIDQWFITEVLPHAAQYRAYARRLCATPDEAEDLVQEAYARTLGAEDWSGIESPKAFVFRVLHNLAAGRARRAKIVAIEHIPDVEALGAIDPAPDPHAHAVARQELAAVEAAIRALPGQCRQVVTLRKIYDSAPAEIAVQLGISVSTVEKHLAKGMRLIAKALADAPLSQSIDRRPEWTKRKSPDGRD